MDFVGRAIAKARQRAASAGLAERCEFRMGDGTAGRVTSELRQQLVDLQRGRTPDRYSWVHRVL